jgi:hypothetical protein
MDNDGIACKIEKLSLILQGFGLSCKHLFLPLQVCYILDGSHHTNGIVLVVEGYLRSFMNDALGPILANDPVYDVIGLLLM